METIVYLGKYTSIGGGGGRGAYSGTKWWFWCRWWRFSKW